MINSKTSPELADAVDLLQGRLGSHLRDLGRLLRPHADCFSIAFSTSSKGGATKHASVVLVALTPRICRPNLRRPTLVEGMDAGASGYILKDSPSPQLMAAIRDVCNGGSYLSPRMLSQLVDDFRCRVKTNGRQSRFATHTIREREVLKKDHQDPCSGIVLGWVILNLAGLKYLRANIARLHP